MDMKKTSIEKNKTPARSPDVVEWLGLVLFCLSALATVYTLIRYAPLLIQSDVASDMVLGRAMAQAGRWLDTSWYHVSALPIMDLLYLRGLLLLWTGNWALTRIIMALLLFGLLQFAAYYALRRMGFSRREFYYGGTLIFLLSMNGMTLMQQYALGLAYIFVELGLLLGCMQAYKTDSRRYYVRLTLLMLLMLATGLSCTRQSIAIYLPLCMAAFFNLFSDASFAARLRRGDGLVPTLRESENARLLLLTIAMLFLNAVGIAGRMLLLFEKYHFVRGYGALTMQTNFLAQADTAIQSFFAAFGYRGGDRAFMIQGIASLVAVGAVIAFCIVIAAMWRRVRDAQESGPTWNRFLLWSFACVMGVTLISMIFGGTAPDVRYFYFPIMFFIPLLAAYMAKRDYKSLLLPCIGVLFAAACCLNCGLLVLRTDAAVKAEAIDREQAEEALSFLCAEGYTEGFAPFWYASVCAERSNGALSIMPVDIRQSADGSVAVTPKRWLSFSWAYEDAYVQNGTRKILLLPKITTGDPKQDPARDAILAGAPCPLLDASEVIYENGNYIIYALPETLQWVGEPGELLPVSQASDALDKAA